MGVAKIDLDTKLEQRFEHELGRVAAQVKLNQKLHLNAQTTQKLNAQVEGLSKPVWVFFVS